MLTEMQRSVTDGIVVIKIGDKNLCFVIEVCYYLPKRNLFGSTNNNIPSESHLSSLEILQVGISIFLSNRKNFTQVKSQETSSRQYSYLLDFTS